MHTFGANEADAQGGAVVCGNGGAPEFSHCTFVANRSHCGGAVHCSNSGAVFTNCTLHGNAGMLGGGLFCEGATAPILENTIIVFSDMGRAIHCYLQAGVPTLTCCDLYGNAGNDWIACIAEQLGLSGNIAADPIFCGAESEDFMLQADSPCAPFTPPNPECDQIGAWPIGCGGTPTTPMAWGRIKATFRQPPVR
jgi:hypothetical protein